MWQSMFGHRLNLGVSMTGIVTDIKKNSKNEYAWLET
jgi:hypothetical protein